MQKKQEPRTRSVQARRFKKRLASLLPPGYNRSTEKKNFFGSMVIVLFYSILDFSQSYRAAYRQLCDPDHTDRLVLLPGTIMKDFAEVLGTNLRIYLWVALGLLLVQFWSHYRYFRQGARADYTLRRLPQKHARFRYCWSLPLLEAAATLVLMVGMMFVFYGYYMAITPDACLTPGQWQKLQAAGWGILR